MDIRIIDTVNMLDHYYRQQINHTNMKYSIAKYNYCFNKIEKYENEKHQWTFFVCLMLQREKKLYFTCRRFFYNLLEEKNIIYLQRKFFPKKIIQLKNFLFLFSSAAHSSPHFINDTKNKEFFFDLVVLMWDVRMFNNKMFYWL